MRVLGVDPGLTRCGLAVVDGGSARQASLVAVGTARTPSDAGLDTRLLQLDIALGRWLELYRPDVVAVERVFSQQNVRTVMGTAQVAGIAVLAAARRGIPVSQHTPSEVKAAVTGSGRAGKRQVAVMVTRILGLSETPRPADASDAVALALCHLWRGDALASLRARDATSTPRPGPDGCPGAGARTDAQQQWDRAAREASRPGAVSARLAEVVARSRSARQR